MYALKLKSGVFGVLIDYEHIRVGGPILWKLLHDLYQVFFDKSSVCKTLKTGLVLPFSKAKAPKQTIKITTVESPFSLRYVKFMK